MPSSPAANEGIKKSRWGKKKQTHGNIFIDVLAVLREERSECGGGQLIWLKRQGEVLSLTFYTLILEPGSCTDGIAEPRLWIRVCFGFVVSLTPTNK